MSRAQAPLATEQDEQRTLAEWLSWRHLVWCHVPNGGWRSPREAAIMTGLGVKAGVPDILVFSPLRQYPAVRGVAIELKRADGGKGASKAQREWLERLAGCGWLVRVCNGAIEAIEWLQELGL